MMIVGMTGGIASGKTEAGKLFAKLGVPIINVDDISHQLTLPGSPLLSTIQASLGQQSILPDGSLNRAWVRNKIFSDAQSKKALEAILHPAIYEIVLSQMNALKGHPYVIIDIPLLFESDRYQALTHRSLLIDCDPEIQIKRAQQRSNLDRETVLKIMDSQLPRQEKILRADDIIENEGTMDELANKISILNEKYRLIAQSQENR
jgi:dephospho-CoA kinase